MHVGGKGHAAEFMLLCLGCVCTRGADPSIFLQKLQLLLYQAFQQGLFQKAGPRGCKPKGRGVVQSVLRKTLVLQPTIDASVGSKLQQGGYEASK